MRRYACFFLLLLLAKAVHANHWEPDPYLYPDNMNVIGVIELNGIELAIGGFELGAFCDGECRGSEMLAFYEGLDRYMVFMTIYGQSGNDISFRLYDHSMQRELELTPPETLSFVPNAIVGVIHAPYVFSFSGGMGLITVHAVPEEGGSVTGGGAYWIGETCTLYVVANEGYLFANWAENGAFVSDQPSISFTVTQDRHLEAYFDFYDGVEEEADVLSVFPNPTTGKVTLEGLNEGSEIRVMNGCGNIVLIKHCKDLDTIVDLGSVPDGCYILYVISGAEKQIKKVVKISS